MADLVGRDEADALRRVAAVVEAHHPGESGAVLLGSRDGRGDAEHAAAEGGPHEEEV